MGEMLKQRKLQQQTRRKREKKTRSEMLKRSRKVTKNPVKNKRQLKRLLNMFFFSLGGLQRELTTICSNGHDCILKAARKLMEDKLSKGLISRGLEFFCTQLFFTILYITIVLLLLCK